MTVIAFTGHRPKDLPAGFGQQQVSEAIERTIRALGIEPGSAFVTGGALGIDTWAADHALRYPLRHTLNLVLPFTPSVMGKFWHPDDRAVLDMHCALATTITVLGDSYEPSLYQRRNEAMVDRADILFAFWTGKPFGGTANCINYAQRVKKPIRNLLPDGPVFGD